MSTRGSEANGVAARAALESLERGKASYAAVDQPGDAEAGPRPPSMTLVGQELLRKVQLSSEQLRKLVQDMQPWIEAFEHLWKTLVRVQPSWRAVLRTIADLLERQGKRSGARQGLAWLHFIYHYLLNLGRLLVGKSYAPGHVPSSRPPWIAPKAVPICRSLVPRGPSALPLDIERLGAAA